MVLNPDVTVRSRGVMEKCSFCVQRLQESKLKAKKEDPHLRPGSKNSLYAGLPYTCNQFGNVNDKESEVSKMRYREQKEQEILCIGTVAYTAQCELP